MPPRFPETGRLARSVGIAGFRLRERAGAVCVHLYCPVVRRPQWAVVDVAELRHAVFVRDMRQAQLDAGSEICSDSAASSYVSTLASGPVARASGGLGVMVWGGGGGGGGGGGVGRRRPPPPNNRTT